MSASVTSDALSSSDGQVFETSLPLFSVNSQSPVRSSGSSFAVSVAGASFVKATSRTIGSPRFAWMGVITSGLAPS